MSDLLDGLDLDKKITVGCLVSIITEQINRRLFGEVMTLIDASCKDVESKRAIKSLISQSFTRNTRQIVSSINDLP